MLIHYLLETILQAKTLIQNKVDFGMYAFISAWCSCDTPVLSEEGFSYEAHHLFVAPFFRQFTYCAWQNRPQKVQNWVLYIYKRHKYFNTSKAYTIYVQKCHWTLYWIQFSHFETTALLGHIKTALLGRHKVCFIQVYISKTRFVLICINLGSSVQQTSTSYVGQQNIQKKCHFLFVTLQK